MLTGLTGAHRSGKTTLGKEFARQHKDFTFAATSVSAIMQSNGYDPARDYPLAQRLDIQQTILTELDRFYASAGPQTIVDRTPLDTAAYLLADVRRQNVTPGDQERIARYVTRCFEITNRRFGLIVFVPSTLPLTPEKGKAPAEVAYVEHISVLINGLKADQRMTTMHYSLRRSNLDLETRVGALRFCVGKATSRFVTEAQEAMDAGVLHH